MSAARPRIWFERPVLPDLVAEVAAACDMLGPATPDDPHAGLAEASGVLAAVARYDGAFMDRAPSLRVIARTGIGYDAVDVAAATTRGIAVCNTPDAPTVSTAEHAAALLLAVAKNLKSAEAALETGRTADYYMRHQSMELDGKTLGLVGCGRIARRLARIAAGIGMRVAAHDPFLPPDAFPPDVVRAATLDELLSTADIVSLHVPLTDASRRMFGADQFARMRDGAIFINTARGDLVDDDALLAALSLGRLAGAGLDVTAPEPLPPDHPLLGRSDVVVTPHIASATADGRMRIFRSAFDQVLAVLDGRRPGHIVNGEVWERVAAAVSGVRP